MDELSDLVRLGILRAPALAMGGYIALMLIGEQAPGAFRIPSNIPHANDNSVAMAAPTT